MNYFAHGLLYLDRPHFLAGSAVPDWLSISDRRARARRRNVEPFLDDPDPLLADVAAGILQHLDDDRWFHQTRAFAELNLQLTLTVRDVLPADDGFRPSFLGHILVEILLDAALIEQYPQQLDAYYATLAALDPQRVAAAVNRMTSQPAPRLAQLIPRFVSERFLYDYADDEKLLTRLNHVMRRVGLPCLPDPFMRILPQARHRVRQWQDELLAGCSLPR